MERLKPSERRHDLDWLRILAVALLVPFHTAMIFVVWDFHIKNDVLSPGLTLMNSFINMWHMPLLFFLAGAGAWHALGFRPAGAFARERLLRLFTPFVFGMAAIVPPQLYVERLWRGQFHGSFFAFYPSVFTSGPYPEGNLSWHHLWFMLYLFLMSLILLPAMSRLRNGPARERAERLARGLSRAPMIYLPGAVFAFLQLAFRNGWPNGDQNLIGDLDNFTLYAIVFFLGFFFCFSPAFRESAEKLRRLSLGLGLAGAAIQMGARALFGGAAVDRCIPAAAALLVVGGFTTWFWLLAFLGFAKARLNFLNRFLKYAVDAALPFYVLHQTVIVLIGYKVIQWNAGVPLKYGFIVLITYPVTIAIYDIAVKRFRILRFLFGMRPM